MKRLPTSEDIESARTTLQTQPLILHTPTSYSNGLSAYISSEYGFPVHVYLKLECLQTTHSYKIRGAYYHISRLVETLGREEIHGIVAASAGNHAQGVAFAARSFGLHERTVIHMPSTAPQAKKEGTKRFGVQIEDSYDSFDAARNAVSALAEQGKGIFCVPPYDDTDVIAGQGTIGVEILEALSADPVSHMLDISRTTIVCPVGGGGLLAGICTWVAHEDPRVRVIGVEPVGCAKTKYSLTNGVRHVRKSVKTVADGVAVLAPGELTFEVVRQHLRPEHIYNVSELRILRALNRMTLEALVAEGAGALALAALMDNSERAWAVPVERAAEESPPLSLEPNERVVLVVSGGNLKARVLRAAILERARAERRDEWALQRFATRASR